MATRAGFRYWRDPVFRVASLLYVLNRVWWKPVTGELGSFVHCYLGDVLCLPVCVPAVLWLQRSLGLRQHDRPPSVAELVSHWLLWSYCFEWLGPRLPLLAPGAIADPCDVVAYAAGGVAAGCLWRSRWVSECVQVPLVPLLARAALAFGFALLVLSTYAFGAACR